MRRRLPTEYFLKTYSLFLRKHPDLEKQVEEVIDRIATDNRRTHIHPLHGKLKGLYSARISQSYRLVFALESDAVIFIDIGSHDDVY